VNDIALALAASPIRIEAPVPGRSVVGIEVPNDEIAVVSLRTIMESDSFVKMKTPLKIALGQDVSGQPVVADLAKMPHLLIAGATGSGKSVCINSIVSGLLFNNSPEQLQMLLIDPKMVELTAYNGIPHLMADVIVELDQVVGALTWVTRIMEERYKLFSQSRARNIEDYNGKIGRKAGGETLPFIVVVIDELADLMMGAPVEVEWAICRIAQMARATGIHLVLATQRPSVDVVTGLIKANFPARISFQVTSQVDSRVMLDVNGAETLLGRGDMLYMAPDAARLQRVQGCFVSDREINHLVEFWRATVSPQEQTALKRRPWADLTTREDRDELLDQATELVRKNGRASASLLQRRLRIGYPRAARLIDQLEDEGIIGAPEEGSRYRQVSDTEPDRWDADLDRELDAEFSEEVLQKGRERIEEFHDQEENSETRRSKRSN
jgi:S-DNA-T family DNA segregation ATPase FtsK/SpoIIIE